MNSPLHDVQQLEVAISSSNLGFVVWDKQQNLVACSKRCPDFWYEPHDILRPGMPMLELLRHIAGKGGFGPGDPDKLARRELQRVRDAGPDSEDEFEMLDGRVIHVQRSVMQDGGHASTYTDITARVRAEKALKQSEERFRNFATVAADWFWEQDADLRFTNVTEDNVAVTGMKQAAHYGKTRRETGILDVSEEDMAAHEAQLLAREPFDDFRFSRIKPDGKKVYISVSGMPIYDTEGNFTGYRGAGRDITEYTTLAAQLAQSQKMEAIGQLTGGVAHDFNNLLQVIVTNLRFLELDLDADDERRKMVSLSLGAAERGAEVTHRLLAYTQQQVLAPEVVDLNDLVTNVVELLKPALGDTVSIERRLADTPLRAKIDSAQMQNALINLALNARDAMSEGGELRFEVAEVCYTGTAGEEDSELGPGTYLMVAVQDDGRGISPDDVERVHEPFFTTKGKANASGLGLSMVHGFAGQSGGHLEIDSEIGVGTTIRLYVPKIEETYIAPRKVDPPPPLAGSETLMLVEDDYAVLDSLTFSLEWYGYTVLTAQDGANALALLEESSVAVLITDISLPGGMVGTELARIVRQKRPDLPVIYITGYAPDFAEIEGIREGDQLLYKPFTDADLAQAVRSGIDGRESGHSLNG